MKFAAREHPIEWTAPAPLWAAPAAPPAVPALLRFETDAFMDELTTALVAVPNRLAGYLARSESHRQPPVGTTRADWHPTVAGGVTKLYQPVHGHFALVAASLICRVPGLPDRAVKRPAEQVGFVVRKKAADVESAWTTKPDKTWVEVPSEQETYLVPAEEVFPLFPVVIPGSPQRSLHVGLIPTSSRETFQAAPDTLPDTEADPRLEELQTRVFDPLAAIYAARAAGTAVPTETRVEATLFVLLDLADILVKAGADWVTTTQAPPSGGTQWAVYDHLRRAGLDGTNWLVSVREAWKQRDRISGEATGSFSPAYDLWNGGDTLDTGGLAKVFAEVLKQKPVAAVAMPVPVPKYDPAAGTRYVVRCVYRRPACRPPHAAVVGAASAEFTIAPFFDPDAPSRPVRIPLPADTSLAGLRKYGRSVAFLASAKLRRQMGRVNKDTLKGELGPDKGFDLGEICSFSLPIITICAMILLILIVIVLNIVFFWMPIFRLCFPIPKPK